MDDGRLTREQQRDMLALLEQAALHDYPNPERKGCPGLEFLRRLATNRHSIELDDPRLTHVARCSPCYREFASFRDAAKRKRVTRRGILAAAGTTAAAIAIVAVKRPKRPNTADYVEEKIDLFNQGYSRGTENQPQSTPSRPALPRKRVDLTVLLPFASPEGQYEVEVLHSDGKKTGVTSSGTANLLNGKTLLHVRLDLSSLKPDAYKVGIRKIPYDWMPVPVEVK